MRVPIIVVSILFACIAISAAAPRKVLVLPLDGNAPQKAKLNASVVRLARKHVSGSVTVGDTTFAETASAVGCDARSAACAQTVLTTLAVDELVYGSASKSGPTTTIVVKRVHKGADPTSSTTTIGATDGADKAEPGLEQAFGVAPHAPPPEDKTAAKGPDKGATKEPDKAATKEADKGATKGPDKVATKEPDKAATKEADKGATKGPDKVATKEPDKAVATKGPDTKEPDKAAAKAPDAQADKPDAKASDKVATQGTASGADTGPGPNGAGTGSGSPLAGDGSPPAPEGPRAHTRNFFDSRDRIIGTALAGGGVIAIAVGVSFWLGKASIQTEIDAHATLTLNDFQELQVLEDRAGEKATIGNVVFAIGVGLGGASAYLFYRDGKHRSATVAPAPTESGTGAVLVYGGAW